MFHLVKIMLMYEIKGPINSSLFRSPSWLLHLAVDFLLVVQRATKFSGTDGISSLSTYPAVVPQLAKPDGFAS